MLAHVVTTIDRQTGAVLFRTVTPCPDQPDNVAERLFGIIRPAFEATELQQPDMTMQEVAQ